MRARHLLMLIPGTLFWVLVIIGVATGAAGVWIAAAAAGGATALGFVVAATTKTSRRRTDR